MLRWPALLRHRRAWPVVALACCLLLVTARADDLVAPAHQLPAGAAVWSDLTGAFAAQPEVAADFTENRRFSFKKEPVPLAGEVRVSAARGLSLHYTAPEERTVILDEQGVLIRAPAGQKAPPADPRAAAANAALLHLLRFDLAGLQRDFELYGRRDGDGWELALDPRTETLRRGVGRITARGEGATIRRIEIRRTETQVIEILIATPRPSAPFTADEVKRFFR